MFDLEKKSMPANVESITFINKMYCPQIRTQYQITSRRHTTFGLCERLSSWNESSLLLSECEDKDE